MTDSLRDQLRRLIDVQLKTAEVDSAEAPDAQDNLQNDMLDRLYQEVAALKEENAHVKDYHVAVRDHVKQLTVNLKSTKKLRVVAAWVAVIAASLSFFLGVYLIVCPTGNIRLQTVGGDTVRISIIVSSFGFSFALAAIFIRCALGAARQEETTSLLPEHVKVFMEAVKGFGVK